MRAKLMLMQLIALAFLSNCNRNSFSPDKGSVSMQFIWPGQNANALAKLQNHTGDPVTIKVLLNPGAQEYNFKYNDHSGRIAELKSDIYNITVTAFDADTNITHNGSSSGIRVEAGRETAVSVTLMTQIAVLLAPANGSSSTGDSQVFDWSDVNGSSAYEIVLAGSTDFSHPLIQQSNLSTSSYTATQSLAEGTYYWRVRCQNMDGNWCAWSSVWSLQVQKSNTSPVASFTVTPTSGGTDTWFSFDASACSDKEDAASALQVRWDWQNDGTWDTAYSTTKTTTHQFSAEGSYVVKLQVKDSGGLVDDVTKIVNVANENTLPTASFSVTPSTGDTDTEFYFDASACSDREDAASTLQVRWDWQNDGTWDTAYFTTKMATHKFSAAGSYVVKLQVKDSDGLVDDTTKVVNVANDDTPPTASFSVTPSSGSTYTVFSFDASGCSDQEDPTASLQVRWDWQNDGAWDTNYSSNKTVTHQYTAGGTYTVKLQVIDTGQHSDFATNQITVDDKEGTVEDIDGNVYQTVKIGNQWWMAENLKVGHYRNGQEIAEISDASEWMNSKIGACCIYDNNPANAEIYGRLYNWYAVSDNRDIAPIGWHVPTEEEWQQLEIHLGINPSDVNNNGDRGTDEGGKLKEIGTVHWRSPNAGATNESGFSALPGGLRSTQGEFSSIGETTYMWSSSESETNDVNGWEHNLWYNTASIGRHAQNKAGGFSVRCVKD
ncbi:hypothetical protein JW998_15345 [candidate division KSB1 bacterium]|nr:hypothetical protein [candidate division KSB1 bacterium]